MARFVAKQGAGMSRRLPGFIAVLGLAVAAVGAGEPSAPAPRLSAEHVEFNRDIRPILSNSCFTCHGPDHNQRKGKLRLDMPEDATAPHKNGTPIVPGDLSKSEIIARITSSNPDEVMPPPKSDRKISPAQIELLKRWVQQGAKYQKHWAFLPPVRAALPEVKNAAWCRNGIDRFVLARLDTDGLSPSPEADKTTLCRRLYLDLLGLPPTPRQVDDFVNDPSPQAYERLVDKLLADPHYGERIALDWLDASRFADTHGYHIDAGRDQTRWRDWVIDAFNRDMPFDRFTVEQLAGDLLPNSTPEQKIATGFVRNNMINFEGGAIPEEYLTAYIMDRVNTTSTVWLGLTVGCCQCHDHKFDPLTQKEYYQLYAFFNRVPENGLDGRTGNAGPLLATPTKEQQKQLDTLAASMKQIEQQLAGPMPEVDAEQEKWELAAAGESTAQWKPLDPSEMKSVGGATLTRKDDHSILVSGTNTANDTYTLTAAVDEPDLTAIRLEALPENHLSGHGPGRSVNGNIVLTDVRISAGPGSDPSTQKQLKIKAASADFSQDNFPISNAIDSDPKTGWAIDPEVGKPHAAVFELEEPLHHEGPVTLTVTLAFDSQFAQHQLGHFRLSATSAKSPHGVDRVPAKIRPILAIAADQRSDAQKAELRTFYRSTISSPGKALHEQIAKLRKEKQELDKKVPTTMVMAEMPKPRDTFVLLRGQYDKHGDKVSADTPAALGALPADAPHDRLGLARWIVAPEQPLTGRVIVNRYWQSFFGTGLVKTAEDFGSQGEEPTHAALLDWLAAEFMNPSDPNTPKWDVKAFLKLIVTSATYRQSSAASAELIARDPENRLLARGARLRLPAEFIRDQALAMSGLLNDEIGGKSVSPYQPPGLWEELMSRSDGANWTAQTYTQDHGKDLYRRTMYTFWKRTSPPPSLATFDAPDRETCTVRRARTNTPLQALVLMNDPTYVEASRKLAERMMTEGGDGLDAKIAFAFRIATARPPRAQETAVLRKIYERQLSVYQKDAEAAKKLLSVGESPRNEKLDQAELAAWSTVASVVLNLDETITKG
jgi:mono/diheme cytochrome c family protein